MKRLKIDLDDLALAFETASELVQYFLDLETGGIILAGEPESAEKREILGKIEAGGSGRWVPIPALSTPDSYRIMMHFIETVQSRELREILKVATSGRGAFRRFKDVLSHYPGERQCWFAFKDGRLRERAAEWLSELGIEPEDPNRTPP